LGIPGVVTVHGVTARRNAFVNLAQDAYIRTIGRRIFSGANRVICLTESDATEIAGYGCPRAKISVVPNGVDLELFKPSGRPKEDLVVWTGRFVPEKGLPDLLRAAKIISEEFRRVKFLLVGFGPGRSKIEQMARDVGLTPGIVEFRGPVTREEVAQILRQATVFAFPSRKEGLPMSILEAMASGKPIVSYRISAIERVITHGEDGLLVAPGDIKGLASAIKALLLDDNLRVRLGGKARSTALEKYSWDFVLHELDDIYQAELEARR
jgi:glycosyltransferase involved in cell wall biosynthesis